MGAWGYGYADNDDYYNEVGDYVDELVGSLAEYIEVCYGPQHFRARFMWTVKTLMATEESVPLSKFSMEILRLSIDQVREDAKLNAEAWSSAEEFLETVEAELRVIEEWLDGFKEMGFLEDRIGALAEAVFEKDSE